MLSTVDLFDNNLERIPAGMFPACPHLKTIDLDTNSISSIVESVALGIRFQQIE